MDNRPGHDFFAHPTQTLHRRYEALRAVFLDQRPLTEVAQQFGYRYGSLRNLVAQFRAQCRTGQIPPFLPPRITVVPRGEHLITNLLDLTRVPRPIATDSP